MKVCVLTAHLVDSIPPLTMPVCTFSTLQRFGPCAALKLGFFYPIPICFIGNKDAKDHSVRYRKLFHSYIYIPSYSILLLLEFRGKIRLLRNFVVNEKVSLCNSIKLQRYLNSIVKKIMQTNHVKKNDEKCLPY